MKKCLFILLLLLPWTAQANCVVGATGSVGGGTCLQTGRILIATIPASSTSNITFSGANFVNTYPRLELMCSALVLSGATAATPYVDVGTGATPTWQQANYATGVIFGNSTGVSGGGGYSLSDLTAGIFNNNTPVPTSFDMIINVPGSTTQIKHATYTGVFDTGTYVYIVQGGGYWNGTGAATTPLTGVQIIGGTTGPGVGSITITGGTCSLYGMP